MKINEKTESVAFSRYVRISPQKIRRLLKQIKGKKVEESLSILKFLSYKSAPIITRILLSAISNFKNKLNLDKSLLIIKEAKADEGPVLKRFCPHAQGRGFPIKKRTSHISIVLSTFSNIIN